ncbi:MAG: polyketide synthase, partial [Catenulispora sp.]|nr:polyketide synthase [Catenulispora sp.]
MSEFFDPIAIVGIAARLPGARNITEYWHNLAAGRESITALTDEELRAAGVPRSLLDDPAYVKMAGLAPDVDRFDARFFGMTAREADICDPQLRLFLEVAYEAIEDAGYDPTRMSRDVAVYGACGQNRYGDLHVMENPQYSADADMGIMVLNSVEYLATLVSYKLNFRGPSMSVLTACSSSLTAVHLACQALQLGECDAALAAASNVDIPYRTGYRWTPGGVTSADGRCRPFDASGTGTIFTSGAGAVLLKRAADAIADGDHIWGVIHGVGVNNDGSDKVSFSAPSVAGQSAAIVDAMTRAGFDPLDIGYVEMHATGTPLGDPIEMGALAAAYRRLADAPLPTGRIPVGSVKGNVGHTNAVAGMAG